LLERAEASKRASERKRERVVKKKKRRSIDGVFFCFSATSQKLERASVGHQNFDVVDSRRRWCWRRRRRRRRDAGSSSRITRSDRSGHRHGHNQSQRSC
jgi:hypothetical protein